MLEFNTVGALIGPCCHLWPMEVLILSVPPMLRLWQELQEIKPDLDNRGSKNSIFPSSTISAFSGFTGLMDCIGSLAANTWTDVIITPIDNSEAVSVRIIIENLLKKRGCNGAAGYA
ncbi:hypothetical protein [Nitrosomonas sp. Nm58]|uniref:hypothetical protein n=1 Tax=Nitrosomonas sp. Nm58 TaxID=200126 RepID=UPI0021090B58|nr:hypothetical protein [Nitrosomonas sp. Nm58]